MQAGLSLLVCVASSSDLPIASDHPLLREVAVLDFLQLVQERPKLVAEALERSPALPCSSEGSDNPSFVQLPDPPQPGGILHAGSRIDFKCACAEGFEVGMSNALPLEVPSVQAVNARCAATKLTISLAPNPARLVSLTPPPGALTAQEARDPTNPPRGGI